MSDLYLPAWDFEKAKDADNDDVGRRKYPDDTIGEIHVRRLIRITVEAPVAARASSNGLARFGSVTAGPPLGYHLVQSLLVSFGPNIARGSFVVVQLQLTQPAEGTLQLLRHLLFFNPVSNTPKPQFSKVKPGHSDLLSART